MKYLPPDQHAARLERFRIRQAEALAHEDAVTAIKLETWRPEPWTDPLWNAKFDGGHVREGWSFLAFIADCVADIPKSCSPDVTEFVNRAA